MDHAQPSYSHRIQWVCTDSDELDRLIKGQFLLFDVTLLNLCTIDEGVRGIILTSKLVSRLTSLGYFDPPLSRD